MIKLCDIIKLSHHRSMYITFANKCCNTKLKRKRENGFYYTYISDFEAFKIYEIWLNNYRQKREIGHLCEIIKAFFEKK